MELVTHTHQENEIKNIFKDIPRNLICFSHLRWDFVYQRPQHLLTRFSHSFDIIYMEEPVYDSPGKSYYTFSKISDRVQIMVPHIFPGLLAEENRSVLKNLFEKFMEAKNPSDFAFWYYTPMALEFSRKFNPELIIYDCMDELSAFKFAPQELKNLEKELLERADIVFTGGHSLYEAKKAQHPNIYPFPSSIEKEHFSKAREVISAPSDQVATGQPVLGFYGVIDERFDIGLIEKIAEARPEWTIVLIGPVVKIDPDSLPGNSNIHYLGSKSYQELPNYLSGWDLALIPFLLNESTRFISPTKTPEYLAAGIPVISTAIADIINPYGQNELVHICETAEEFIMAAEYELTHTDKSEWLRKTDSFLSGNSWDHTYRAMLKLIQNAVTTKTFTTIAQQKYV